MLSLRHACAQTLWSVIGAEDRDGIGATALPDHKPLVLDDCVESIQLNSRRSLSHYHPLQIFYSSAIAHRWAQHYHLPVQTVIDFFANQFQSQNTLFSGLSGQDQDESFPLLPIHRSITPQGWIDLTLEWPDVVSWLQHLPLSSPKPILVYLADSRYPGLSGSTSPIPQQADLPVGFWQHTHARCCSLLRQAIIAELVNSSHALAYQKTTSSLAELGSLTQPHLIPWQALLQDCLTTSQPVLAPTAKAERELLLGILTVLDAWTTLPVSDRLRSGLPSQIQQICQVFTQFHRHCRIGTAIYNQYPDLVLARLGLVSLTQRCLWELLQDGLGLAAPCWV